MADYEEIEADHAQKKGKGRERNWKDEEIEVLITLCEERPCLWDVGHKDYLFERWEVFRVNRQFCYDACTGPSLYSSSQPSSSSSSSSSKQAIIIHKVPIFLAFCRLNAMFLINTFSCTVCTPGDKKM